MENILQVKNNSGTLLGNFIDEKVRQYVEPSREGTPRGETIGFSAAKYGASLYGLTNAKQKQIAEYLEISHGLLRKWNTEEPFKGMVDKHCREFAEVFVRNIRDRIKRREALNDAHRAQSIQEIASQDEPSLDYEEISDARYYSKRANSYIINALCTEIDKAVEEQEQNITLPLEIFSMIDMLNFYQGQKKVNDVVDLEKTTMNRILKAWVENGIEILLKPGLDEEDKKSLLILMKAIARSLR